VERKDPVGFSRSAYYPDADHRTQRHVLKLLCSYPAVERLNQLWRCGGAVSGAGEFQLYIRYDKLLIGLDLRHKLYADID
jgi:hypothetical protein